MCNAVVTGTTTKDRRKARFTWLMSIFMDGLRQLPGNNTMLTVEKLNQILVFVEEKIYGATVMSRLEFSLGDVKTVAECAKDMSDDELEGVFTQAKQLLNFAQDLKKDHSKSKQPALENESFKDRLNLFQKTLEEVKDKVAPMLGLSEGMKKAEKHYCLKWVGGMNMMHMTLEDLRNFPDYMEDMLKGLCAEFQERIPATEATSALQVIQGSNVAFQSRVASMLKDTAQQLEVIYDSSLEMTEGNPHDCFKICLKKFFAANLA